MKTAFKYICAAIVTLGILPMLLPKFFYLFVGLLGLYWVIRFRHVGKSMINERKKFNKYINLFYNFSEDDVIFAQIGFLLFGILAFIVGLGKFLSN